MTMMYPFRMAFIAAILVVPLTFNRITFAEDFRTWSDATGKHRREAQFVELKDGNVHLKKEDGTVIFLPIEKLSKTDQEYARKNNGPLAG